MISGGEIENLNRLNTFFDEMASQKQTIIRVTDYDQGGPRILELYFNGLRVDCTEDDTPVSYTHLAAAEMGRCKGIKYRGGQGGRRLPG